MKTPIQLLQARRDETQHFLDNNKVDEKDYHEMTGSIVEYNEAIFKLQHHENNGDN
jgi:hypothetical protein